jgi:hypothetical protein
MWTAHWPVGNTASEVWLPVISSNVFADSAVYCSLTASLVQCVTNSIY